MNARIEAAPYISASENTVGVCYIDSLLTSLKTMFGEREIRLENKFATKALKVIRKCFESPYSTIMR